MHEGELLSVGETATRLGVTTRRVRVLAGEGRLPGAWKIGRDWAIPAASVAAFQPNPRGVPLESKKGKPQRRGKQAAGGQQEQAKGA